MQFKNLALAAFSLVCLVGALAATAIGRSESKPQDTPKCDSAAVVGAGQTAIYEHDGSIYVFDRDYMTIYQVNTSVDADPAKGYPTIRTKLR